MPQTQNVKRLKKKATEVASLLRLVSHPNRLLISCDLTSGEKAVSEIEENTGVLQPHLSRELARLREAGLIKARRKSKNVYYRIADRRLVSLIDALCDAF